MALLGNPDALEVSVVDQLVREGFLDYKLIAIVLRPFLCQHGGNVAEFVHHAFGGVRHEEQEDCLVLQELILRGAMDLPYPSVKLARGPGQATEPYKIFALVSH